MEKNTSIKQNTIIHLIIITAIALSYIFIIPEGLSYLGFSLSFITTSTFLFFKKKFKKHYTYIYYLFSLLFSFFIIYRIDPLLTFFNLIACTYTISLLVADNSNNKFGVINTVQLPLTLLFVKLLGVPNKYSLTTPDFKKKLKIPEKEQSKNIIISLGITFAILIVVIPLLSYSNPFFEEIVNNTFKFLDPVYFLEKLFGEFGWIYLVRIIFIIIFIKIISKLLLISEQKELYLGNLKIKELPLTLAKNVLILVLIIFFTTQIQLYFATPETLKAMDYSNSMQTNEVFAQLSIVALVIFGLVYNDKSRKESAKISTYVLLIQAVFLTFVALKSVFDYSTTWGFTQKRLYGYAVILWILGLLISFTYKYVKEVSNTFFIKTSIIYSAFILLGINVLNFDYIIYHYAKASTPNGIDHYYLSKLSTDSKSYKEHLEVISEELLDCNVDNPDNIYRALAKTDASMELIQNTKYLKEKYENIDIRSLHLSEYTEYRRVKDIDTNIHEKLTKQCIKKYRGR